MRHGVKTGRKNCRSKKIERSRNERHAPLTPTRITRPLRVAVPSQTSVALREKRTHDTLPPGTPSQYASSSHTYDTPPRPASRSRVTRKRRPARTARPRIFGTVATDVPLDAALVARLGLGLGGAVARDMPLEAAVVTGGVPALGQAVIWWPTGRHVTSCSRKQGIFAPRPQDDDRDTIWGEKKARASSAGSVPDMSRGRV
jgi:hypothetical protein